jgi:ADP-ribose pyrophosphatase
MRSVIPKNAKLIPPEAKLVFKGILFDVYQWEQELFDGKKTTFEMLRRPDTVKVIAIKDGKIVMLDEAQPHYGRSYELPGGRNDFEGEDELACAKREVLEETGMTFKTWKLIKARQPAYKIEHFVYIFLATDFVNQVEPKIEAGEDITVKLVSFDDCFTYSRQEAGRYLPTEILEEAGSLDGLLALPEYR